MKIAVLGGFGLMAEAALHDLAANPAVTQIYAADINLARAKSVLAKISNRKKIKAVQINIAHVNDLALSALKGAQCVINASWYEYNLKAMDLALALRAHYVDLGGLYHMTLKQLRRSEQFRRAKLLGLLGCGSTPGITNMMVARLAESFDTVDTVGIYNASHDPSLSDEEFLPPFSLRTMLAEYELDAPVLHNGRIKNVPARGGAESLDFKKPIGRVALVAAIHSETATLPGYLKDKGVKNVFFKIAYPESVTRRLSELAAMERPAALARHAPDQAVQQQQTAAPNDFEILRVNMTGKSRGQALAKTWDCEIRPTPLLSAGSAAVGFTASIGAAMLVKGRTSVVSGTGAPESFLSTDAFFEELKSRKIFSFVENPMTELSVGEKP